MSPVVATTPNTKAIGLQIVKYLQALTYPDGGQVYKLCQLEEVKDIVDLVSNGGVCVEVYGNKDGSQRRGFGGRMWDMQSWFLLSLCSLDTPDLAAHIYDVRDALVVPFQQHVALGDQVANLFQVQLKESDMRFLKVFRNGLWLRAHLCELETRSEWLLPVPPGVMS